MQLSTIRNIIFYYNNKRTPKLTKILKCEQKSSKFLFSEQITIDLKPNKDFMYKNIHNIYNVYVEKRSKYKK